jgi:hypothetical protein
MEGKGSGFDVGSDFGLAYLGSDASWSFLISHRCTGHWICLRILFASLSAGFFSQVSIFCLR